MANNSIQTRLSELPSKASLSPDDILLIDDGAKTYSITYSDIKSDIEKSAVSSVDLDRLSNRLYAVENEVSPEVIVGLFSTDTDGVTTYQLDEPLAVGTRYKFTITNSTDLDDTTYRVYLGLDNINREIGVIHTDLATNYITFRADRAYDKVRVAGRPDYSLEITRTRHTKLNKPLVDGEPSDGNSGQYLRSLGNGSTEWVDVESALRNFKDAEAGGTVEGLVGDDIPEASRNKATGKWAHAEGGEADDRTGTYTAFFPTIASGQASHAEGSETTASGHYSHAEGCDGTTASGVAAHAEGAYTRSIGNASHSEGVGTVANHRAQHVFGEYNILDDSEELPTRRGNYVEIVGNGQAVANSKEGIKSNARTLDWAGNEKLAGSLTLGMNTADETTITAAELKSLKTREAMKFVKDSEGEVEIDGKTTQYTGAVVEGLVYDSIPEEHRNKAIGNWAHAEGGAIELTVVPEGYTPETLYFPNTASGYSSHAEGADTVASGNYSHAEGRDTLASSGAAHAEGAGTKATHGGAHAEGGDTTASGPDSHAENWKTTASGRASHAEGNETTASAENSHSEGYQTTSSGQSAHAEGEGSTASSEATHAEGIETVASGNASHAEGFSAKSIGTASHAQGGYTTAKGAMSDATGMHTVATGRSQHVFGELNIEDSANDEQTRGTYIEIVGNGTPNSSMTDGTRSNARTLDWSGNEALSGSLTLGKGSANETTISPAELKSLKEATHLDSVRIAGQTLTPASNEMTVAQLKTALGTASKTATGLVPALPNETTTTKYLRQDGTWAVPPDTDTNTTYTAGNGLSLSGTEFRNTGVTGIKTATDSDFRSGQITLTKDSVGLAAVENKSSATIREELTRENVLQALGYDPAGVLRYKGIQPTLADIQALTGSVGGDVWFCTGDNTQYAYNGSTWDSLGTIDLTGTITYIQNWVRDYIGNVIEAD